MCEVHTHYPLNMFRLRELTLARSPEQLRRSRRRCVPFGIFPRNYLAIIKGWSGLGLSLTCRQDDFAEDLSEEGKRTQTSGTG